MKRQYLHHGIEEDTAVDVLEPRGTRGTFKTRAWHEKLPAGPEVGKMKELKILFREAGPSPIRMEMNANKSQGSVKKTKKLNEALQLSGLVLLLMFTLFLVLSVLINNYQAPESYVEQKITVSE